VELIVRVIACLAEGLGIRGTARVFEIDPNTVLSGLVETTAQLVAPGCVPLFVSDGNPNSLPAIVAHFGHWVQPPRRQDKGPAPKPRWMPLPELLDAQVVKTLKRRRLVEVKHRVIFGTKAAVDQVLAACG
jgi:hypothetical protein